MARISKVLALERWAQILHPPVISPRPHPLFLSVIVPVCDSGGGALDDLRSIVDLASQLVSDFEISWSITVPMQRVRLITRRLQA
jgi:hypothetical protein